MAAKVGTAVVAVVLLMIVARGSQDRRCDDILESDTGSGGGFEEEQPHKSVNFSGWAHSKRSCRHETT